MKWKVEDKAVTKTIERQITQFWQSPQVVIFRYAFLFKGRTVVATEDNDLPILNIITHVKLSFLFQKF